MLMKKHGFRDSHGFRVLEVGALGERAWGARGSPMEPWGAREAGRLASQIFDTEGSS